MGLDYFAEDVDRFRELAKMYRENPVEMDNEIRDDILAAKIYLEPNYVGEFIKKYKEISDPDIKFDYLSAACLVRDEEEVLKLVGLLGDFKTVKPQDQLYLFIYLYRNPKARKKVWVWLKENWEFVKKSGGDKTLSDYPMIIARIARTKEELEEYLEFFGAMRDDPAVSRAVLIGEREIKARLRLIERFKGGVLSALEGLE